MEIAMPPSSPSQPAAADEHTRPTQSEERTSVLVEAVGLAGYCVAGNGSGAQLALVDASGVEVAVMLPQEGIASLMLTLPTIMDQLVRRTNPDPQARFVFGAADWRLERGPDAESLILTLETPDRFRVSFAFGAELARGLGRALASGADRLAPPRPQNATAVLQ